MDEALCILGIYYAVFAPPFLVQLSGKQYMRFINPTLVNWLNGARLSTPSLLTVDIHAIGLGTAMDLKGSIPQSKEKSLDLEISKCSIVFSFHLNIAQKRPFIGGIYTYIREPFPFLFLISCPSGHRPWTPSVCQKAQVQTW